LHSWYVCPPPSAVRSPQWVFSHAFVSPVQACTPDWPCYNRDPIKWLPSMADKREKQIEELEAKREAKRVAEKKEKKEKKKMVEEGKKAK
jgi:hypothetical protein